MYNEVTKKSLHDFIVEKMKELRNYDSILELTPEEMFDELDSLDHVELIMDIEEKFGLNIPEEKIENVKTLDEYIECILK